MHTISLKKIRKKAKAKVLPHIQIEDLLNGEATAKLERGNAEAEKEYNEAVLNSFLHDTLAEQRMKRLQRFFAKFDRVNPESSPVAVFRSKNNPALHRTNKYWPNGSLVSMEDMTTEVLVATVTDVLSPVIYNYGCFCVYTSVLLSDGREFDRWLYLDSGEAATAVTIGSQFPM